MHKRGQLGTVDRIQTTTVSAPVTGELPGAAPLLAQEPICHADAAALSREPLLQGFQNRACLKGVVEDHNQGNAWDEQKFACASVHALMASRVQVLQYLEIYDELNGRRYQYRHMLLMAYSFD